MKTYLFNVAHTAAHYLGLLFIVGLVKVQQIDLLTLSYLLNWLIVM